VVVELWYPTAQGSPVENSENAVWVYPKEVRDGSFLEKKHPLIIFSHGHGGDRRDLSWLAEILAKKGYMVASVDHYGNTWKDFNPIASLRFWERARDVSFAITEVLKDARINQKIDSNRIGFVGYSLGGMTGLALGGARGEVVFEKIPEMDRIKAEFGEDVFAKMDFSESRLHYGEPRIKAMALLTPAAFSYSPESLKAIQVPVAVVVSEGDEVLPFELHGKKIITHLLQRKVKMLKEKVSHFVFLNKVSPSGKKVARPEFHSQAVEADRALVHQEVGDFVSDFFKENLK
jgi:predicted dienelactone hydrolase